MERVSFFFDGFNIYHSLDENRIYHKYKWLDYNKLASLFIKRSQKIVSVYYFTAYQQWKPGSFQRHKDYVKVLRSIGVKVVLGKFKDKDYFCNSCRRVNKGHIEKQSDINMAIQVIGDAYNDEFDTAILATADSDQVPTIQWLRGNLPVAKEVGILFPIGQNRYSVELKNEADFTMKIKEYHLAAAQLSNNYQIGSQTYTRPLNWS